MNTLLVPHVGDEHLSKVVGALDKAATFGWRLKVEALGLGVDDYWKSLTGHWRDCALTKRDLMLVEHDVVIHDQVFDSFDKCPLPVCAFSYWLGGSYDVGLGCTRFRASLIHMHPGAVSDAGRYIDDGLPTVGHWKRMDTRMWHVLGPPHVHEPPVKHLHRYPYEEPCEPEWT